MIRNKPAGVAEEGVVIAPLILDVRGHE